MSLDYMAAAAQKKAIQKKSVLPSQEKKFGLDEIKKNPELILNLLLNDLLPSSEDVSIVLEKQGDQIRYSLLKVYRPESLRILHEAKEEYNAKVAGGYSREDAFQDLAAARDEIEQNL